MHGGVDMLMVTHIESRFLDGSQPAIAISKAIAIGTSGYVTLKYCLLLQHYETSILKENMCILNSIWPASSARNVRDISDASRICLGRVRVC